MPRATVLAYFAGVQPPNAQARSHRVDCSSSSTSSLASMASSKGPRASNPAKGPKGSNPSKPAPLDKPSNAVKVSESPEKEDDCLADGDLDKAEAKSVWYAIRRYDDNKENLILAVIKPEQVGPLMERVEKRGGTLKSKLVVTTPGELQRKIDAYVTRNCRKLYLLASTTVCSITYHISGVVKDVFVYPCGKSFTGQPDTLSIGGDSTYCDVRAYQWDQLPQAAVPKGRQITYGKGCSFDMRNHHGEAQAFLRNQPSMASTVTTEDMTHIKEQLQLLQDELASGPPEGPNARSPEPVSAGAARPTAPASTDGTESWFQRWKLLLAAIVGGGTGAAVAGGFMWCSAGGIFVKGPLGLSLAAGYFSVAAGGGGMVFDYVKLKLWQIWDYICHIVAQIWQKIKSLASAVMSKVPFPCASQRPKPARFSA